MEDLTSLEALVIPVVSTFHWPAKLCLLTVNKKMRWEALPFAHHGTVFHTDEVDDLVELLVAVGGTSRDNIVSMELRWESSRDSEVRPSKAANEILSPALPTLHAARCVQQGMQQA